MPTLNFLLTNPRLTLEAKKNSEEWTLGFDAKIVRPEGFRERFTIFCGGKEYDGYDTNCTAIIKQRTAKNESQPSPVETNDSKLAEEVVEKRPGYVGVAYPPPEWNDSEKFPPFFTIKILLPADTFLRVLQANPETHLTHLSLDTNIRDEGLVYGNDPDGKEIEWRAEKKSLCDLESIRLTIKPCEK